MALEELSRVCEELNDAKKKAREFAQSRGREAVGAAFRAVFEKFPELGLFGWRQYTPHFNDGDACVFGVHGAIAAPAAALDDGELDEWYDHEFYGNETKGLSKECHAALREIWDQLEGNEELLESMFGDHAEVRVTKDEVSVEECSHD
jgi:hypothetical protein